MQATQLADAWKETAEPMVTFASAAFAGLSLSTATTSFLEVVGLPASAAPFLDFEAPMQGPLKTVAELWQQADPELQNLYVIGSNGSGDATALTPAGKVMCVNHDTGFDIFYINKDVLCLSMALLRFRALIAEACAAHGPDAYLDGKIPTAGLEAMRRYLQIDDREALAEGSLWAQELEDIERRSA